MQIDIPTQSAAMFHIDHVRRRGGIGARSALISAVDSSTGGSEVVAVTGGRGMWPRILSARVSPSRAILSPRDRGDGKFPPVPAECPEPRRSDSPSAGRWLELRGEIFLLPEAPALIAMQEGEGEISIELEC